MEERFLSDEVEEVSSAAALQEGDAALAAGVALTSLPTSRATYLARLGELAHLDPTVAPVPMPDGMMGRPSPGLWREANILGEALVVAHGVEGFAQVNTLVVAHLSPDTDLGPYVRALAELASPNAPAKQREELAAELLKPRAQRFSLTLNGLEYVREIANGLVTVTVKSASL